MGGPPGPPPPPGMGGMGGGFAPKRPAKPKIKPSVKMKALNWSKIPDTKIDNSFWDKCSDKDIKVLVVNN